ncbi:MAG: ribonuclease R [Desulfohalobiaceae bacterium]
MPRRKKNAKVPSSKDVLALFRNRDKPLGLKEIYAHFHPEQKQKQALLDILNNLEAKGKLVRLAKGKAYGLTEKMDLVRGTLEMHTQAAFVLPEDKRRKDVYISKDNLNLAWHGDRVVAALLPRSRGKNPEGRIVRILHRALQQVPVILHKQMGQDLYLGRPAGKKLSLNFMVQTPNLSSRLELGDVAIVRPGEQLDPGLCSAQAQEILGPEQDLRVQERIVKLHHEIPTSFPEQVLQEAQELPEDPEPEELLKRRDLRGLQFVTIDGAKAKDFDDAVLVQKTRQGFKLYVAIADVSHYVPTGCALDQEAQQRANSCYFPNSVEPMFPETLSNGLCSLNPGQPRLAMVAELDFDSQGQQLQQDFYPALIQSQARLTYSQVKKVLLDLDPQSMQELQDVLPMLQEAEKLARLLHSKRRNRGSLDFDLPEPEILFSLQEDTLDIRPKVQHFGHQIIEEFMIAANEAVASFLTGKAPCMYRIHPEPDQDKLKALFELLQKTSFAPSLPQEAGPKGLQELLQLVQDSDLEFLVNRLLLRTMMQASYSPQNIGHFGLASDCYCHFTSPIRRYADLVVHRSLKNVLSNSSGKLGAKKLSKLGEHLSIQERKAMAAEREIIKRLTVLFLQDKLGESFEGVISSITEFGFWVELVEVMADGLVRLSTLVDDYYIYWPKEYTLVGKNTGRMFTLGQRVKVRLSNVSLSRQEIDLELEEEGQ